MEYTITVTPAATGRQLIRVSLPLPVDMVLEGQTVMASDGQETIPAAVRALTWHPVADTQKAKSVRRALVTFPYTFTSIDAVLFSLTPDSDTQIVETPFPMDIQTTPEGVTLAYHDGLALQARFVAPPRVSTDAPRIEIVESNAYFIWQRIHICDEDWPRIIEIRTDILGGVTVVAHLRHNLPDRNRAPDFGWDMDITATSGSLKREDAGAQPLTGTPLLHTFAGGVTCELMIDDQPYRLSHPAATLKRRGRIEARRSGRGCLRYQYLRCMEDELVPMQPASWRRAEFVVAPATLAPPVATLESPHALALDWPWWDALYRTGKPIDLTDQPVLAATLQYHHDATVRTMAQGDDWGNVSHYSDERDTGSELGMNRLNHCPAIFEEGWRTGDRRLIDVAVLWCDNFHDLTIWWGSEHPGGTRYPNSSDIWRSNASVDFCTKGYDSFFLAYEQTGDPRMKEALDAQVRYAAQHLHADRGECRNIGDVRDFIRLYEYTGEQQYLHEALRLFRELRTRVSADNLFDQNGKPLHPDPPFINNDQEGINIGYPKPYIIGYALAGLPDLVRYVPDEPGLRDLVQAVADFLAESQDALGAWRYPHPRSSGISLSQAIESAWQIVQADRLLGPQNTHMDAIERVLRQRILGQKHTGKILDSLAGWENTIESEDRRKEIFDAYRSPADRDGARDYIKGPLRIGGSAPEGLVYYGEVLRLFS